VICMCMVMSMSIMKDLMIGRYVQDLRFADSKRSIYQV